MSKLKEMNTAHWRRLPGTANVSRVSGKAWWLSLPQEEQDKIKPKRTKETKVTKVKAPPLPLKTNTYSQW